MSVLSGLSPGGSGYPPAMRREDWAARLTDVTAERVRHYRDKRDMTAQQVVDACVALGLPMKRSVLVNLEHGRRGNVTLAELLALSDVLGVHPVELVFPIGKDKTFEALPGRDMETWDALRWFTGESGKDDTSVQMWREHARHVAERRKLLDLASSLRADAETAKAPDVTREMLDRADRASERADFETDKLRFHRAWMRRNGIALPDVTPDLAVELGEDES